MVTCATFRAFRAIGERFSDGLSFRKNASTAVRQPRQGALIDLKNRFRCRQLSSREGNTNSRDPSRYDARPLADRRFAHCRLCSLSTWRVEARPARRDEDLCGTGLGTLAARAQDATWVGGNTGDPNERIEPNWTPTTDPTATATFTNTGVTTGADDAGIVVIGAIDFTANAQAYSAPPPAGSTQRRAPQRRLPVISHSNRARSIWCKSIRRPLRSPRWLALPRSLAPSMRSSLLQSAGLNGITFSGLSTTNLPADAQACAAYTTDDVLLDLSVSLPTTLLTSKQNVANPINNFVNSGGTISPGFGDFLI